MQVFYLCNGKNPVCSKCAGCYLIGGECRHTRNLEYSNTIFCADPWNHPERFEKAPDSSTELYFEKELENKQNV